MNRKTAIVLVVAFGLLLVASNAALAEEAQKGKTTSLAGMLYTATFTDAIGFFDMFCIYCCSLASIALIIEHAITIRRVVVVPELSSPSNGR